MITLAITDANIHQSGKRWHVVHPHNDAILAYCNTREEAVAVREMINDMPRQMRTTMGQEVR